MNSFIRPFSMALVVAGALFSLFPLASAARMSGTALAELPDIAGTSFVDDHHRLAIFSDDFEVASRTYQNTSVADVRAELVANDYERSGNERLSTACCGTYDGVWVALAETPDGDVTATLSPIDTDIRSSWPVFPLLGIIGAGAGLALVNSRVSKSEDHQ